MIRFSKILFINPANIWISGIRCSCDNIIKIAKIFNCKWIALTIDSVKEEGSLISFIKEQGVEYYIKRSLSNYIELSVVVPDNLFINILEIAMSEDPENIFIFNLLDVENWNNQFKRPLEELVATGTTNVFMSISIDEKAMLISINKYLLSPREVYRKIKALKLN